MKVSNRRRGPTRLYPWGLAPALGPELQPAVLSWLLAARYKAAMIVQVFEIAIALTLAPVVGSIVAVIVTR